jgi:hypothetical protein
VLRAALYFAQHKLKRASPALRGEPLARAERLVGDAPLRGFAPGPFEGEWAAGLGGLLRATTAIAASARPYEPPPGTGASAAIALHVVLTGAWGGDAPAAAKRLLSAWDVLAQDALGHLTGIDHPVVAPQAAGDAEALHLEVALDPMLLARGLHAATDATLSEILGY